jgi:hypothetical protein
MKTNISSNSDAAVAITLTLLLAISLIIVSSAKAQNIWDGGSPVDSNWNTPDNWDNNLVPSFPVALTFSGTTRLNPSNNLVGPTQVNGITFASGAGAFTLSGNAITLAGNIKSSNAASNIINFDINRTTGITTIDGGSSLELAGVVSGVGGIIRNAFQGGTLRLSNVNNSFTGAVSLVSCNM